MFFNIGVPGQGGFGKYFDEYASTFKGAKIMEGLQAASAHQNWVQLEAVSIHN